MDIGNNIKNGLEFVGETVSEIAACIAEKNRLRIQLNHIKGLIKADSATRDQAYIELGRYFYENQREGASAENEAICAVIDAASDRISKASLKYVELLNIQNDTKIRSENAEKLAKAMSDKAAAAAKAAKEKGSEALDKAKESAADFSEKAKASAADFAEKAKVTAADLKDMAADKADELKERFDPNLNEDLDDLIAAEQAKVEEAQKSAADAAEDVVEDAKEAVKDAKEAVEDKVEEVKEAVAEESPEDAGF